MRLLICCQFSQCMKIVFLFIIFTLSFIDFCCRFGESWLALWQSPVHIAHCVHVTVVKQALKWKHRHIMALSYNHRAARLFDGVSWHSVQLMRKSLLNGSEAHFYVLYSTTSRTSSAMDYLPHTCICVCVCQWSRLDDGTQGMEADVNQIMDWLSAFSAGGGTPHWCYIWKYDSNMRI